MTRKNRIKSLQDRISAEGICAALLFYSRDVFYYTGTAQPAYLVVFPDDYVLYIRSGFAFASNEVFIDKTKMKEDRRLKNIAKDISSRLSGSKIATELDVLPATRFFEFKNIFSKHDLVDISPIVLEQRKLKDNVEIEKIKLACEVVHAGHEAVLSTLKEGITELELSAAVENAHRLAGHEGIFFIRQPDFIMSRGPISSGPNLFRPSGVVYTITGVGLSASVPAGPSRRKIVMGDPVVVDIPTLVDGYHADQTRTYILGKATEKLRSMYERLKEISDFLIEEIRPGMTCSEIYEMALKKSDALQVSDAFLNFGKGNKSRIIGHGVGLELNEPPILSSYDHSEVSEGYVIALDMHMLKEDVGVVKLEDMILIQSDRNEILTKSPRQLFEIE